MNRKWFRIDDSLDVTPGRWYLDLPVDSHGNMIDPRILAEGRPVERIYQSKSSVNANKYCAEYADERIEWTGELMIPLQHNGAPLDITFGAFDMLVTSPTVADLLETVAPEDFQRLPARVEGQVEQYEIVNVIRSIDCVDEDRTRAYEQWAYEDPNLDIPGKYSHIGMLGLFLLTKALSEIDPRINLWRIQGHAVCLICSESVKRTLEEKGITGVRFTEVI